MYFIFGPLQQIFFSWCYVNKADIFTFVLHYQIYGLYIFKFNGDINSHNTYCSLLNLISIPLF